MFKFWKKKVDYTRTVDREIEEIKKRLTPLSNEEQKEIVAALLKFAFPACHIRKNPTQKGA
jgi:hypothetical protein